MTLLLNVCLILFSCQGSGHSDHHAQKEAGSTKAENFDCRNCGMPSQDYPNWNVQVLLKEDKTLWFCSPKCMFVKILDGKTIPRENLVSITVNNYYDGKKIDGQKAFYVSRSKIMGPMGRDLVPHFDKNAAEDFQKENQGEQIYTFEEITMEVLKKAVAN